MYNLNNLSKVNIYIFIKKGNYCNANLFFFPLIYIVSRRCIPFFINQTTVAELNGYIQLNDLLTAVSNIEILANINGVCEF